MKLKKLIAHIRHRAVLLPPGANADVEVRDVVNDSRRVAPGDLFVAIDGNACDGARYIDDAVNRGAVAVVTQSENYARSDVPLIVVEDAREALSALAAEINEHPSTRMNVVGITGTNGKTSVSMLVRAILEGAGQRAGLLGTIRYDIGTCSINAPITTPESADLQRYMAQMCLAGCSHAVMEVSSHALCQKRVNDVDFDAAVFTNLTSEHLDYHRDMDDYFRAKAKLFEALKPTAHAVINADDPYAERFAAATRARVTRYGLERDAEVGARVRRVGMDGSRFTLYFDGMRMPIETKLIGRHNIANCLAAAAVCLRMGVPAEAIKDGLEKFDAVPGRLERVDTGRPFGVFVDYAHTEDALHTVLSCARPLVSGKLITVFGCGGDRDRSKRAPMAAAAARWSEFCVVTSDNPRAENPLKIIDEICVGFTADDRYVVEPDRAAAIETAITMARHGDLILIAGKGHEKTQKFADREIPFDDREAVLRALQRTPAAATREREAIATA